MQDRQPVAGLNNVAIPLGAEPVIVARAHGVKKGRTYTLSPAVYKGLGRAADDVRQAGFEPLRQEEMVRRYVAEHGSIRRQDVAELCRLESQQAKRLLSRMARTGVLVLQGAGKGSRYVRGPSF